MVNINKAHSVEEILVEIELLNSMLINSKTKKQCELITEKTKNLFNKLYFAAYYDSKYNVCNYNKLIADLKENYNNNSSNFLFLNIKELNQLWLENDFEQRKNYNLLIKNLKILVKKQNDNFIFDNIYIISDYLVFVCKKKTFNETLKNIKNILNINNCSNYKIYFSKYKNTSSKISKNLANTFKNATKHMEGSRHD